MARTITKFTTKISSTTPVRWEVTAGRASARSWPRTWLGLPTSTPPRRAPELLLGGRLQQRGMLGDRLHGPGRAAGDSTTGSSVTPPTASRDLAFPEGESATRSIPENTPAGINVGAPVSAEGDGTLTYTMSGPDAASFTIVPTTGRFAPGTALSTTMKPRTATQ